VGAPICDSLSTAIAGSGGPLSLGTDVDISGDLEVTGTLTVGGQTLGYPSGPQYFFGSVREFCTASSGNNVGWIDYPTSFATPPVVVAGIDESLNDSGASWIRLQRAYTNRTGVRCNSNADGLDYLAFEPGSWVIDSKNVQAGITAGPVVNGQAIFFDPTQPFTQPPVVLLMVDESGNQSGATKARIISNVTTGGFEIYSDGTMDNLHWVAMDAGEYTAGRWHWYAGVFNANNTCSSSCNWTLPAGMFSDSVHGVMAINDTNNNGAVDIRHRLMESGQVTARLNSTTENIHYVVWENL
jgi:hypothetical protein